MAIVTLPANNSQYTAFKVPSNDTVIVDVEAEDLVDIYFLKDYAQLQQYLQGNRTFPNVQAQKNYYNKINLAKLWPTQSFVPSFSTLFMSSVLAGSTWYLAISNRSATKSIAIFWRVYNSPDAV